MRRSRFDVFAAQLLAQLEITHLVSLRPETSLVEDLCLDSLQLYELIAIIERMCAAPLPPEPPMLRTLGDAYAYYSDLSGVGVT